MICRLDQIKGQKFNCICIFVIVNNFIIDCERKNDVVSKSQKFVSLSSKTTSAGSEEITVSCE